VRNCEAWLSSVSVLQTERRFDGRDAMQIGYATTFQNPLRARPDREIWDDEVRFSLLAEELGFDAIWSTEHHFTDYEMIPNPVQFLTYMAGRTTRVRLGTMVIVLPWHDPVRISEEIAVLDSLSDGRMILGIGRGVCAFEFDGLRVPMDQSRTIFNEAAELVLAALETGWIESDKGHFKIPRRAIRPDPLYSFRHRVFGAGGSSDSMPIMARLGAGLLIVPIKPWNAVIADVEAFRAAWARYHPERPAPRPLLDQFVLVHEDEERAKELAHLYIGTYFAEVLKHYNFGGAGLEKTKGYEAYKDFTSAVANNADKVISDFVGWQAWGTPKQVIEKLDVGRRNIDASSLLGHFLYGGMPATIGEASMRLFAEKVAPAVGRWVPDPFADKVPLNLRSSPDQRLTNAA
jgi:alkanesulfonate monooxygenase SsuD/methylene tetrahydromethanopterin reductase-like flavin-dependent oxidoreductase (luciferase family)